MLLQDAGSLINVNAADYTGITPLIYATITESIDCINALQSTGNLNVDIADGNGCTALHHGAERGAVAALRLLMKYGADPNKTDNHGTSLLHRAVIQGKVRSNHLQWPSAENYMTHVLTICPSQSALVTSLQTDVVAMALLHAKRLQIDAFDAQEQSPLYLAVTLNNVHIDEGIWGKARVPEFIS